MKTFKAIILNFVYPGVGYLYLHDPDRQTIAKFLVFVWTAFICALIYELIKALITGNFLAFSGDMQVPGLAGIMWVGMSVDTYFLGRKLEKNN